MLSTRVRTAAVLGCGSPIIGIAPALLEHLGDDDVDRIVIHEWAHVQRRDDIVQYLQLIVRVIAGWHPAVWWLERQLDLEREVACDETAVVVTGSATRYAACLTTLAGLSRAVRPLPALAAVSSSGLRRRIVRILALRHARSTPPWRAIAIGASAALATLALAVGNVQVVKLAVPASSLRAAAQPVLKTTIARPTSSSTPVTARRSRSSARIARPATLANTPSLVAVVETKATQELPAAVMSVVPLQSLEWSPDSPVSPSVEMSRPLDASVTPFIEPFAPAAGDNKRQLADATVRTPWSAAADAGVAIGRGSQNAGIGTAGFFTRVGKRIAGSF